MLFKKDRKILNLKTKVKNRDILIAKMEEQAEILQQNNNTLNIKVEELQIFKEEVVKIVNQKDTIVNKIDKIKELVDNLQTEN